MDDTAATPAVPLTLGQLEVRLQLAMAARDQLRRSQQVHRAFVQASMEAYGLELPTHMPARAFTTHPSRTYFEETLHAVETYVSTTQTQLASAHALEQARLQNCIASLKAKVTHHHQTSCVRRLHTALSYWADINLEALRASQEPLVRSELTKLDTEVQWWANECMELGQLVLQTDGVLYQTLTDTYAQPTVETLRQASNAIGVWKYAEPQVPSNLSQLMALLQALPDGDLPSLWKDLDSDTSNLPILCAQEVFYAAVVEVSSLRQAVFDMVRRVLDSLSILRTFHAA